LHVPAVHTPSMQSNTDTDTCKLGGFKKLDCADFTCCPGCSGSDASDGTPYSTIHYGITHADSMNRWFRSERGKWARSLALAVRPPVDESVGSRGSPLRLSPSTTVPRELPLANSSMALDLDALTTCPSESLSRTTHALFTDLDLDFMHTVLPVDFMHTVLPVESSSPQVPRTSSFGSSSHHTIDPSGASTGSIGGPLLLEPRLASDSAIRQPGPVHGDEDVELPAHHLRTSAASAPLGTYFALAMPLVAHLLSRCHSHLRHLHLRPIAVALHSESTRANNSP
jgi:hypothetical protein